MAKLNIGDINLELAAPKELSTETTNNVGEITKIDLPNINFEQFDPTNLQEEIDSLKIENIALSSELDKIEKDFESLSRELREELKAVQKPIVKEIKVDKTNRDDLVTLEREIAKSVDSLNEKRRLEIAQLTRAFAAFDRYQTSLNVVIIAALVLILFLK